MKKNIPTINNCIDFTLDWLIHNSNYSSKKSRYFKKLIIKGDTNKLWDTDENLLSKLLTKSIINPPFVQNYKSLAKLLIGLGEMSARCHIDLMIFLKPLFLKTTYKSLLPKITKEALTIYEHNGYIDTDKDKSLSKTLLDTPLSYEGLEVAQHICDRPGTLSHTPRYGLYFIIKLYIIISPTSFTYWFNRSGNTSSAAASILVENIIFDKNKKIINSLLTGGSNFLVLLSASVIMTNIYNNEPIDYKHINNALLKNDIDKGDAVWISALVLKELIHSWYRLTDRVKREADNIEHYNGLIAETYALIEKTLSEISDSWPETGLSEHQFQQLNFSFVNTYEFIYKLAIKLNNDIDKQKLLTLNTTSLNKSLGISIKKDLVLQNHYTFDEKENDLIIWAAHSFLLIWKKDSGKSLAKKIGNLVGKLTDDLNSFIQQPYIASRQTDKWLSATSRLAATHYFVLVFYSITPKECKSEIESILPFSIKHIILLLTKVQDRWLDLINDLPDKLIHETAFVLREVPLLKNKQESVVFNEQLPDHLRALMLWAKPKLVVKKQQLANKLFLSAGVVPLSHNLQNKHFNRILNVLDIGIANSTSAQQQNLIIKLWKESYEEWKPILDDKWEDAAEWLISAINGNAISIKRLKNTDGFNNSYCYNVIQTLNK